MDERNRRKIAKILNLNVEELSNSHFSKNMVKLNNIAPTAVVKINDDNYKLLDNMLNDELRINNEFKSYFKGGKLTDNIINSLHEFLELEKEIIVDRLKTNDNKLILGILKSIRKIIKN